MIIVIYPSFTYPLSIRYLTFCEPILYLSFLGFQLWSYFAWNEMISNNKKPWIPIHRMDIFSLLQIGSLYSFYLKLPNKNIQSHAKEKGGCKKITNSDKDLFKTFQCRRAISVSHDRPYFRLWSSISCTWILYSMNTWIYPIFLARGICPLIFTWSL